MILYHVDYSRPALFLNIIVTCVTVGVEPGGWHEENAIVEHTEGTFTFCKIYDICVCVCLKGKHHSIQEFEVIPLTQDNPTLFEATDRKNKRQRCDVIKYSIKCKAVPQ